MNNLSITTTKMMVTILIIVWCLSLVHSVIVMFCGNLFKKASINEKTAMYPVLNLFGMLEVCEVSSYLGILFFIPVLNIIPILVMSVSLGKVYNASIVYKLGLVFLPIIFYPLLARSDCHYKMSHDDYFNALDNARSESINLMTQEEINDINSSVDETENMNSIDSIFKSKINDFTAPEPYRASKLDQEVMRRSDNLPFEDTTFKPIARNDNFAMLDTSEKKAEKTSTSVFTSELERKEDVEIVDL